MGTTNTTLAAIRARLAQQENQKTTFDNAVYPFWNAKTDTTSVIRFVPDGDTSNEFFWAERLQIKLPFNGIKNGDSKPVYVSVPCVEMFGKSEYPQGCPILSEVRAWYKDPSLTEKANKYWKKPTYIMQGFVRENVVADDTPPENPIRRFMLNKQLFNLVKAGIMDVDMENMPCDYSKGSDFRILKTTKGPYADYSTSSYARKESSLTKVELEAIEKYGLPNLSDFLGKKPSKEDLVIIREMFEASVDGEAYDEAKWGKFYRPAGMKTEEKAADGSTTETLKASEVHETVNTSHAATESVAAPATTGKANAADILDMIRNRATKAKTA